MFETCSAVKPAMAFGSKYEKSVAEKADITSGSSSLICCCVKPENATSGNNSISSAVKEFISFSGTFTRTPAVRFGVRPAMCSAEKPL